MAHSQPILSLVHVDFAYPSGRPLLADLCFDLHPGERIGLFGHNGEGKTTLFRLIVGLEKPLKGEIRFHDSPMVTEKDFQGLRRKVGLVLQHADDQLFCPTVLEDVAFGPLNLGLAPDEARERSLAVLARLGLAGFGDRLTHRLSGGEKKLVSLAGVLVMEPEALLLDEPTSTLDPAARERLAEVLEDLDMARITISHDWTFLSRAATGYVTLDGGRLHSVPDPEAFFALPGARAASRTQADRQGADEPRSRVVPN